MGNMNFFAQRSKVSKFQYKDIENPYISWDSAINPRHLLWEIFDEPVSHLQDERQYSNGVVAHLTKHGVLIDEISIIDKDKKSKDESYSPMMFYHPDDSACQKFLYKNNIVDVRFNKDETQTLTFFRPLSHPFVVEDFAQWILVSKGESKVSILVQANGGLIAKKVNFKASLTHERLVKMLLIRIIRDNDANVE